MFWSEAEFFIFDDVSGQLIKNMLFIDSEEGPYNTGTEKWKVEIWVIGQAKGGYFSVP